MSAAVAGAAPGRIIAARADGLGRHHVHGLTEAHGPTMLNVWKDEWKDLELDEKATIKSGARACAGRCSRRSWSAIRSTLEPPEERPDDGRDLHARQQRHEGYPQEPCWATAEAFEGGWFHTGDPPWHPGRLPRSRTAPRTSSSPAANISSIEVEDALQASDDGGRRVARPDEKWGETPCAPRHAEGRRGR